MVYGRRQIYRGAYLQRGRGVGSVVSGLFRLLVPFIRKGAKAALKSRPIRQALKSAKKSAIKTATTAATDIISGKNPKQNAKMNIQQAKSGIQKALIKGLNEPSPSVKIKKKTPKRKIIGQPMVVINKKTNKISKKAKPNNSSVAAPLI